MKGEKELGLARGNDGEKRVCNRKKWVGKTRKGDLNVAGKKGGTQGVN